MTDIVYSGSQTASAEIFVSRAEARRTLILSRRNDAKVICQPIPQIAERIKKENQADDPL